MLSPSYILPTSQQRTTIEIIPYETDLLSTAADDGHDKADSAEDDEERATSNTKVSSSSQGHDTEADVQDRKKEALLEEGQEIKVDEEKDDFHDSEQEEDDGHDEGEQEAVGTLVNCCPFVRVVPGVDTVAVERVAHEGVGDTSDERGDRAADDQNDVDDVWNRHHEK